MGIFTTVTGGENPTVSIDGMSLEPGLLGQKEFELVNMLLSRITLASIEDANVIEKLVHEWLAEERERHDRDHARLVSAYYEFSDD